MSRRSGSTISKVGIIKVAALVGLVVGIIFFILSFVGLNIPIVIDTTSYEGTQSALIMLIGFPIIFFIIGIIASIFTRTTNSR